MNGQKHTYRYAATRIISERYFRQFCRAFGLREIIVMLCFYLISATLCACLYKFNVEQETILIYFTMQRYNFFLTYANFMVFARQIYVILSLRCLKKSYYNVKYVLSSAFIWSKSFLILSMYAIS